MIMHISIYLSLSLYIYIYRDTYYVFVMSELNEIATQAPSSKGVNLVYSLLNQIQASCLSQLSVY